MRQSAVIREFEVIGEAVGKLPDDLKQRAPEVAWQVVQIDLPALIRQVEALR